MLSGTQLAGSALSFLTAVIITRIGGAVVFGQISVGLSVLAYALIATNFGTDVSGVRMAAANPERIGAMLPGIMAIRLFFGVLTFAVILLLAPILAPDPQGRVIMLIICFGLFAGAILPAWLPQGIENAKVTALCVFGPFALTFAFTALSALVAPSGRAFAVSRLSADAVVAASLFAWAWRFHDGSRWKEIRAAIRDLLGQSSAIAGTQLVRGLAFLSDILIVSFFYHDATVGHFSAAYRIYLLLIAVSAMYFIVLFPKLARAAERGPEALKTELRATLRWTIPSTSLMALAFTAVVPWLLPLAFGADFSAAVPALQVLGIAAALNFIQRNYSRALVAMGFPGVEFRIPLDNWASNQLLLGVGPGFERYTYSGTKISTNIFELRGRFGYRHVFGPSVGLEILVDGGPVYAKAAGSFQGQSVSSDGVAGGVIGVSYALIIGF